MSFYVFGYIVYLNMVGVLGIWSPFGIVYDGNLFLAVLVFSIGYLLADYQVNGKEAFLCLLLWGIAIIFLGKCMNSAYANLITALLIYIWFNGISYRNCLHFATISKLGPLTYGIYLTHHIVIREVTGWLQKYAENVYVKVLCFVGVCVLTVVYTSAIYKAKHILCRRIYLKIQHKNKS